MGRTASVSSARRVVEDARLWTVMCSYNRVNGVHLSAAPWLLTTFSARITGLVVPLSAMSSLSEVVAHPVAGPKLVAAMEEVMKQTSGASALAADGVDIARLMSRSPSAESGCSLPPAGFPLTRI